MRTTWLKGRGFIWKHKGSVSADVAPTPWDSSPRASAGCPGVPGLTTAGQGRLRARHALAGAHGPGQAAREAGLGLSQQCSALACCGADPQLRTRRLVGASSGKTTHGVP